MTSNAAADVREESLMRGGFAGPLDSAADYIRRSALWLVPAYVLAAGPLIAVAVPAISAIMERDAMAAQFYAVIMVPALIWRWAGLALIQSRVFGELSGKQPAFIWKRMGPILALRMVLAPLAIWGMFLMVAPSLAAMSAATLTAPLLLDGPDAGFRQVAKLFRYSVARGRAIWLAGFLLAAFLILSAMIFGVLQLLQSFVFPALLGISDARISMVVNSGAMNLGLDLLVFLLLDLLWCIAGVILYLELDASRTGTDLRIRLQALLEAVD